jgi:hypothetical protein
MRRAVITAVLLAAPRAALACPVCFGQNDSPLAVAMNQGILLMLGVVALVLGAFASFFVVLIRRARAAELAASAEVAARPAAAGHYLGSQEGTAQC